MVVNDKCTFENKTMELKNKSQQPPRKLICAFKFIIWENEIFCFVNKAL